MIADSPSAPPCARGPARRKRSTLRIPVEAQQERRVAAALGRMQAPDQHRQQVLPSLPTVERSKSRLRWPLAALDRASRRRAAGRRLMRRLLLAIEGDRFHTQPFASATVKAVRRVTFVLACWFSLFPALDFAGVELAVGLHHET